MMLDLRKVKVTARERRAFGDMLSNWDNLHAKLTKAINEDTYDAADVAKMLKVEVTSRRRFLLATRLLAIYHRLCREENERRLAAALAR